MSSWGLGGWTMRTLCWLLIGVVPLWGADWPGLPAKDDAAELPAQEWALQAGPRTIRVKVHYPGGALAKVTADTGVLLSLHNWGGTDCVGTANPRDLADRFNVVALCVNYLQSGKEHLDQPYDFGYLQALDALRALYWMYDGLQQRKLPFAKGRLFTTGGSGGGNVSLMANKLAPATFACIIDMCGMPKLSDDIAYNLPGGSSLNARYVRDAKHPHALTLDHQELRFVGNPDHLAEQPSTAKVVVVHGVDDATCPYADAVEMVAWMKRASWDVDAHWIDKKSLDGEIFTSSGHPLGNRTKIVAHVAGKYLDPKSPLARVRAKPTNFDTKQPVIFTTSNGRFVIDYAAGYPVGRFESATPPPTYDTHTDVRVLRLPRTAEQPLKTKEQFEQRRHQIRASVQQVMGPLPSPLRRVPLAVKYLEEVRLGTIVRHKLTYQADPEDRVPAYLFLPAERPTKPWPAILCLHQTTKHGKDEPAGLRGDAEMKYAIELAERGFVVLVPDYPSLGEHQYDFKAHSQYASGSMKAIWDNVRGIDFLETRPEVDASRLGVLGHSLGGHNAMFTALFEPRLKAIVSSCGFTTFVRDDLPSWNGPRYMPRIQTVYKNDVKQMPFDFPEIVAAFAPRPFLAVAAEKDSDFDVVGVRDTLRAVEPIYRLYDAPKAIEGHYPPGPHAFPAAARKHAYEFLERHLR